MKTRAQYRIDRAIKLGEALNIDIKKLTYGYDFNLPNNKDNELTDGI
jgi:hypothetical protein